MIKFDKFWQKLEETGKVNIIENGERKTVRLTQSLLCRITGLSSQTIDELKPIEKDKIYKKKRGVINLKNIGILCDFFNCQPCDLMEYVNNEENY